LHGFVNRFTLNDAGRVGFDAAFEVGFDGTLSVDRLTERVHNAAEERGPNGHFDDAAGTFDRVAFFDFGRVTEERDPDVVLFEVQDHALNAAGELEELSCHGLFEAVYARDAVTDGDDGSGLCDLDTLIVVL